MTEGFLAIPNEVYEALACTDLSGGERRVLDVVFRQTYGFNKKRDWISKGQLVSATRMDRTTCIRCAAALEKKRVIIATREPGRTYYEFNVNLAEWSSGETTTSGGNPATSKYATTSGNPATSENATGVVADPPPTIDTLTKDNPSTVVDGGTAATRGNPIVNGILSELLRVTGLPALDGTRDGNRRAAWRLYRKALASTAGDVTRAKQAITLAIRSVPNDKWHAARCTSVLYLEKHWIEILNKVVKTAPKVSVIPSKPHHAPA